MQKAVLLLVLFIAGAFTGCKKDNPSLSTPDQLLGGAKWQLVSSTYLVNLPGFTLVDNYATMPLCSKDDFQQFNANNAYAYDEGLTKCDPLDPQRQLGVWYLGNLGTQLTVTCDGVSTSYTVDQLTPSSLMMHSVQQNNGIEETTSLTYKAVN